MYGAGTSKTRMSCLYALADILDAAPNAFHHVKLIKNRKMTRLDANLKAVLEIGRYASETPGHGDAAAEKFSIARSTAYELEAEYKRYRRADKKGKPFKLIKRPSKVPTKRRGRAGIKPTAIAEQGIQSRNWLRSISEKCGKPKLTKERNHYHHPKPRNGKLRRAARA
jgi:hypothetical protein